MERPGACARTGLGEEVGGELGGNGLASVRFAVGARVAKVGHDGCDGSSAGALARVDGDQQLHQVVVHRRAAGLHQEHVAAANRLLHAHKGNCCVGIFQPAMFFSWMASAVPIKCNFDFHGNSAAWARTPKGVDCLQC